MKIKKIEEMEEKIPFLGQIAFGICDISSNPDFFAMMDYSRKNGVIPNYTCNGLEVTENIAQKTADLCGAVAVSLVNKKKSYEAIAKFLDAGMTQCNMHYLLSEETYDEAFEVIDYISKNLKPKGFNAVVFLQYKHKNKKSNYHSVLDVEKYTKLINYCNEKQIAYGFDSCSAPMFLNSIQDDPNNKHLEVLAEPCESGLFSSYIKCYGKFFVCSFAEGEDVWQEGIDVLNCNDFLQDVWLHPRLIKWRERLINNKRECPIYNLSLEGV